MMTMNFYIDEHCIASNFTKTTVLPMAKYESRRADGGWSYAM